MAYHLAIVGYGGMGEWHHRSIAQKVEDIRVTAAYDIRSERREAAKAAGLQVFDNLEALLFDPDIHIVTVATPNDSHKHIVAAALQAGKHVVCEKPAAMNAGELQVMMDAAKDSGRLFSIHQNRRWDKDYRVTKTALQNGSIGKPYLIESRVQGANGAMHDWRAHPQNGGGMLLDWGVHLLDQVMGLVDEPVVSVMASLRSICTPEVDDNIKLMLRFAGGCTAVLEMSTNCFIPLPRWHVQGTEGTLVVDDWSAKGKIMKNKPGGSVEWQESIVYTEAGPTRTMAPRPIHTLTELPLPAVETDWSEYYQNFAAVLSGKAELIVRPEQALRVMQVIDLLFRSEQERTGLACHI